MKHPHTQTALFDDAIAHCSRAQASQVTKRSSTSSFVSTFAAIVRWCLALIVTFFVSAHAYAQVNNATFISQSVPTGMTAGKSYPVAVTMQNSGTTTWTSASLYNLGSMNPQDNTTWTVSNRVPLGASVAPGQQYTFNFSVKAPATFGTYNFQWKMVQDNVAWFGGLSTNVAVAVVPPAPTGLTPNGTALVAGATTATISWNAVSGATVYPIRVIDTTLGAAPLIIDNTCGTTYLVCKDNATTSYTFPVIAGHSYSWWVHAAVPSFVSDLSSASFTVPVALVNNASFVSQSSIPTTMTSGQTYSVAVTMQNTGTTTWASATSYSLGSQNPQDNTTWGTGRIPVGVSVAPGQQYTFNFTARAPATGGIYQFQWKMVKDGIGGTWFGATSTNVAVAVNGPPPPISAPPKTATRTSSFEYDAATGLLTKEIVEPNNTQFRLETTYVYDAWGNKTSATVSSPATGSAAIVPRSSTTAYDTRGQFPTSSRNALSQSESRAFDARFGSPTSLTGPNQLTTQWQYDSFGRKVLETRADGTKTKWQYLYCSGVNGGVTACPNFAKYLVQTTPLAADGVTANGPWGKTYYDSLDREIKSETLGFDGTTVIAKSTEYDSLGRAYRSSRPYYSGQTVYWTTQNFDAGGRVSSITAPDNTQVNYGYNGLTTTVTNALSQTQTKLINSQGQLVRSTDAAGTAINYAYDAFGNLWKTTDPNGNTVLLAYDLRGRKIQMADADMGNWSYTYNALGELVSQTDAKLQVSSMAYDKLGRMTSRSEPDLVSTWTYDNCIKGVGKLCRASADNGYVRVPTYDSLGRPTSTATTVDAAYTSSITYDANGRVATQTYPTGFAVKYVYTTLGYLKEVRNNASNALYWSANTLDAEGHLLNQTYGNGIATQQVFDPATGRLKNIYAGASNGVQNLSYVYDAIGQLTSRNDTNQSLSETFLYDTRNRLTSSTVNSSGAGVVTQTYTYDSIGNMTSRTGVGTYTYGGINTRPHAVTSIAWAGGGQRQYTYDANGNLTAQVQKDALGNVIANQGRTVTYTGFNMPKVIATPSTSITFAYDTEHQRVKEITPSLTTIYLNPDNTGGLSYEKDIKSNGSIEHRHFITAGGQVIAVAKQISGVTTVSYFHRDNLGSTTAVTNEAGTVIERLAYEPFGKRRFASGSIDSANSIVGVNTTRGFTNHEHLDGVGLIHMNGRVYDPVIGRFMTADPFIQAPGNLQSYNRYSYVLNNPLMLTDPSGYFSLRKFLKGVVAIVATVYLGPWIANSAYASMAGAAAATATAAGATLTTAQVAGMWSAAQFMGGAAAGFVGGLVNSGGDFNQAMRSGMVAGMTAYAFNWAGGQGAADSLERYAAHAAVGCGSGELGGGGCGRGAASAVAGKWTTNATQGNFVASVVAGGTVSVIGGGKFANGATTAAFGYLYNACGGPGRCKLLGGFLGFSAGVATSGACTAGSAGLCAPLNVMMTGAATSAGASLGAILDEVLDGASSAGAKEPANPGREKDVPNRGEPGEVKDGERRTREYGSDGKPVRDYDKPHQGYDRPHVHEWPGGQREHPGRDYSPWPRQ